MADCPGLIIDDYGFDVDGNQTGTPLPCIHDAGHDGAHEAADGRTWEKAPHE